MARQISLVSALDVKFIRMELEADWTSLSQRWQGVIYRYTTAVYYYV
ncbi:hypothetical protein MJD09_27135 [bacterium]|nr:hypothetical protein [bacterium]